MDELTTNVQSLDLKPLDASTVRIAQQILDEQDVEKVKDLTALFNLNAQKRNVMRVIKMNSLLDKVTDQISERFERYPANFSNDDLIKYMQVTENAIDRANKNLHLVEDTPPIQLQQNNVNVNIIDTFDRESKERVADAIKAILAKASTTEDNVVEVVENVMEENGDTDE